ncbi:hypothetical protein LSH36_981g00002, partial [Paralvinella palmiformis]
PEKVTTRFRLCDGPTLVLQDVGQCGTTTPKYINDLSFRIFFGWAELGFDLRNGVVSSVRGSQLIDYKPPTPPPGSGLHRYQIFLFESPEDSTGEDMVAYSPSWRAKFNLTNFIIRNNLCYNLRATFQFSHQEMKYAMNRIVTIT